MTESPHAKWTVLVGTHEEPADGVRDYCRLLADALNHRGIEVRSWQVCWAERGWIRCLCNLWMAARDWKDHWVLVQYTPLAWSRRGFPFGAIAVMATLRLRGARTAVMFHDWTGYSGPRAVDRVRWASQRWAMRRVASMAERTVLPVPPRKAPWLTAASKRAVFIPIGANLPVSMPTEPGEQAGEREQGLTVGVYCVTSGEAGMKEAMTIGSAIRSAASRVRSIRLVVLGRGSRENQCFFERALDGAAVELSVLGLLPAEDVARELSRADAILFVRGEMLGQRGSAIAGIACGVPVVGYGDPERAFPLSEAGVVLVRPNDSGELVEALCRVLTDGGFRLELRERSQRAHAEYFSWDRIAERFAETLSDD